MALFVVVWSFTDDTALIDRTRAEHRSYVRGLADDGIVRAGGPWADRSGGLLVYEAADRARLRTVLDKDPYVVGGIVVGESVYEWDAHIGPLAETA